MTTLDYHERSKRWKKIDNGKKEKEKDLSMILDCFACGKAEVTMQTSVPQDNKKRNIITPDLECQYFCYLPSSKCIGSFAQ